MTKMYAHCTYNLNPRAPSIDTPLHSFVPYKIVDHTHPVSCIAIATAENGKELTQEIYGDEVIWVDWQRPGFELGLQMQRVCEAHPNAKGIMMGGHGLINWASSDKECYLLSLSLIERAEEFLQQNGKATYSFGGAAHEPLADDARDATLAEVLPWLRGQVSQDKKVIGTVDAGSIVQDFVNGAEAERLAELGTSCPDHFLRTRIKPLFIDWDPQQEDVADLKSKLADGLEQADAHGDRDVETLDGTGQGDGHQAIAELAGLYAHAPALAACDHHEAAGQVGFVQRLRGVTRRADHPAARLLQALQHTGQVGHRGQGHQ